MARKPPRFPTKGQIECLAELPDHEYMAEAVAYFILAADSYSEGTLGSRVLRELVEGNWGGNTMAPEEIEEVFRADNAPSPGDMEVLRAVASAYEGVKNAAEVLRQEYSARYYLGVLPAVIHEAFDESGGVSPDGKTWLDRMARENQSMPTKGEERERYLEVKPGRRPNAHEILDRAAQSVGRRWRSAKDKQKVLVGADNPAFVGNPTYKREPEPREEPTERRDAREKVLRYVLLRVLNLSESDAEKVVVMFRYLQRGARDAEDKDPSVRHYRIRELLRALLDVEPRILYEVAQLIAERESEGAMQQ